jgi:hypothetical protein
MGQSKSPRRCANCGHDVDHHSGPACQRCRPGRRCAYFRSPRPALIVCIRTIGKPEWTRWRCESEAIRVERELCRPRCGPKCEGGHLVVAYDGENQPRILPTAAPPPPLAVELRRCYPKPKPKRKPKRPAPPLQPPPREWPTPSEFNEPLEASPTPNITGPRIRRGEALALAQKL